MPAPRDDAFLRGARLFDAGDHFAAHEAWEERWRVESVEEERRFLQGLIQVAAAYHKLLVQRRPAVARRLLLRGLTKLAASPGPVARHGLAPVVAELAAAAEALARGTSPGPPPRLVRVA